MYAPNAPPSSDYGPNTQPPPYPGGQGDIYPKPIVGQPQGASDNYPGPGYSAGYPQGLPAGYPPAPQPGYPPAPQPGYAPAPQPGYPAGPLAGFPQDYPQPYGQPYQQPYAQPYQPYAPGPQTVAVPQQPPVTVQPGGEGGGWMPPQQSNVSNCPPGLEYLAAIDQLLVHQKVELLEAFVGFETSNKYTVKNTLGQKVYHAAEISDCCTRQCCGPNRAFEMKIVDNLGNEVIHLNRPLACTSCFFPCCLQNMEVTSPPGTPIGSIQQEWSILSPKFTIKDASGETVLTIEGPICTFSMCGDVEFNVFSRDGSTKVGKISKQWSGFVREAFTDSDMFGINFPIDLDVKIKAVLLGACFLIDFMFFEKAGNEERDRPGML